MASPDSIAPVCAGLPDTSANIRKESPVGNAETPASLTVTPLVLNEKMAIASAAGPLHGCDANRTHLDR